MIALLKVLFRYAPLGSSGFIMISSFLEQNWIAFIIYTPFALTSLFWVFYSEIFLNTFLEIYAEKKTAKDTTSWINEIREIDKAITEAYKRQLNRVERKYLALQSKACGDFITENYNLSDAFAHLLNEVYIPLCLSSNFYSNLPKETAPLRPEFKWSVETKKSIKKEGLTIWDILKQADQYPDFKRLAIINDNGSGKTTLLYHITYIYTHQKGEYTTSSGIKKQAPKLLPILISLKNWQETITENELDLPTLIERHHIPNLSEGKQLKLHTNWAENHLKKGNMLVMFDGFDKVEEEYQDRVCRWLGEAIKNYKNSIFILTSSPSSYKNNFLPEYKLKSELLIKPLSHHQRSKFIHNWYRCLEKCYTGGMNTVYAKQEAKNNADSLLKQLDDYPELDNLTKSPLLLNIITTLHRSYLGAELPKRRSRLYADIIELQLGKHPIVKQVYFLLPANEAERVLQMLALYLVQNNKPVIEYDLLLSILGKSIKNFDNIIDAEQFLAETIDMSKLLIKKDKDYEFTYPGFQSYLAAKEIIETKQENLLIENWNKSWWQETILLYSDLVNPNDLLRSLIRINSNEALNLAELCIQESSYKIDPDVYKNLANAKKQEQQKK
jgi:predicted NACHT family NTPase